MGIRRTKIRQRAFILALFLAFAGCGKDKETMQEAPELIEPVNMTQESIYVQYRDVYSLQVTETVVLPYQEELSFSSSGTLEDVYVYVGKEVEEGEVLAELSDDATAAYERLLGQLEQMREENAYNNRHLEIDIEIAQLSGQDTARMELQLKQAKELQEYEEGYLLEMLEAAQEEGGNYQLTAPFSGTVIAIVDYWDGMAVSEGNPFLVLASDEGRYLQTDFISQDNIDSYYEYYVVVDGKRYELEYIPRSEEELQSMTARNETKTSMYRMLDAQEAGLGRNAFLCMVQEYRGNVLAVPKSVLYKEGRNYYVYVVDGESHVRTPVEVGLQGGAYAEIISGLEEGACIYEE